MNSSRFLVGSFIVCVLAWGARADDKSPDNAKRLVGKWEVVKSEGSAMPVGSVVELSKDGKAKATVKKRDRQEWLEGTYKLDGDKIMINAVTQDKEEIKRTATIKKITDTDLVVENEKGETLELKKKTK